MQSNMKKRLLNDNNNNNNNNNNEKKIKLNNDNDINNNNNDDDENLPTEEDMIRNGIINLLNKRGILKTCWPSEIPRLFLKLNNWKDYLTITRNQSIELAKKGIIDIEQKGKKLLNEDLLKCKGPIRLRLKS